MQSENVVVVCRLSEEIWNTQQVLVSFAEIGFQFWCVNIKIYDCKWYWVSAKLFNMAK